MKLTRNLFTLLAISLFTLSSCDDKTISPDQLPTESTNFIETHFPNTDIFSVEKDYEDWSYEVTLTNGTEIEFNRNGEWKSVDNHIDAIPNSIIPAKISEYFTLNIPNAIITEISKDLLGYEVEIDNQREFDFNKDGEFVRENLDD